MQLLIVDDDDLSLEMLAHSLEREGYDVFAQTMVARPCKSCVRATAAW